MPRLVTFGCSFAFGQDLADCRHPWHNPSKFAWPNLLAEKLGRECLNLSRMGRGNMHILMHVLQTEFHKDDLVIMAYSFFDRYRYYRFTDFDKGEYMNIPMPSPERDDIVKADTYNPYIDQEYHWYNYLTMHHIELYLNSKNIENYSFLNTNVEYHNNRDCPELIKLKNFWPDIHCVLNTGHNYKDMDFALDGRHPGPESHKLQAQLIYNKLRAQNV